MTWTLLAQFVSDALAFLLILRLLTLRLYSVYRVFCLFLISELLFSLVALAMKQFNTSFDYRIIWMCSRLISWVLSLWVVYALLDAILENFPGLKGFSRKVLAAAVAFAIVLGAVTGIPEYSASGISGIIGLTFVLDRVISTTALVLLISILGFILWFPVQMPRNLAVFSVGFTVYFAAKTVLMLTWNFWSHESLRLFSNIIIFILGACYLYWIIFLTPQGKVAPVRMGHSWRTQDREQLLMQLEAVNASLLRTARRSAS